MHFSLLASVKFGGQIAIIDILLQPKKMPDVLTALLSKAVTAHGILVGSKQLAEGLIQFIHAKKLRMPVKKVFGFSEKEAHDAYANIQNQTQIGKTVIRVN